MCRAALETEKCFQLAECRRRLAGSKALRSMCVGRRTWGDQVAGDPALAEGSCPESSAAGLCTGICS